MADIVLKDQSGQSQTYSGVSKIQVPTTASAETFVSTSDANATANDVLANKTAYVNSNKIIGTIPTKTESDVISTDGVVTIPAGYYATQVQKQGDPSGDDTVSSGDQILFGLTAHSQGVQYTGTIPTKTDSDIDSTGGVVTIPSGYYAQQYQVQGDPSGDATATADDLIYGKTAYSKGSKITGSIPTQTALSRSGAVVTAPAGYYAQDATLSIPTYTGGWR